MKPFNLEEAKAGKPVVTKNGKPVRILCFDRNHSQFPIVALVPVVHPKMDMLSLYTIDGRYSKEGSHEKNAYTLYMKTEKETGWVNIYRISSVGDGRECHRIYKTKEEAIYAARQDAYLINTIKIEWEE